MNTLRVLPLLLALATAGGSARVLAGQAIYGFVDEAGGINLSNEPDDGRYQMLVDAPALALEGVPATEGPPDARAWLRYRDVVLESARRFRIDPALLRAVIRAESGYDHKAVSRRGAAGLMQLMPATARRLGVADVFNPAQNVQGGARYLVELMTRFDNDLHLALAAYNAGEGAVLKYGRRIPPYPETTDYVARVVGYYRSYRAGEPSRAASAAISPD